MKVIVTGGRDYDNRVTVKKVLQSLRVSMVVQGGASGADLLAKDWALDNGIPEKTYDADWTTHGRAAGPIRNENMLEANRDAIVVAFPGGSGTQNCIQKALSKGMIVLQVRA